MLTARLSQDRGHAHHGWLNSYHSFSFADYYDPRHMGFRVLRVLNEDRIDGGTGFPPHPHRDMEIISYVIDGAIEHKDSMNNSTVIRPGEVQIMSAGTGVTHSEFNHFSDKKTHFLQIWILTEKNGVAPSYDQKSFSEAFARGGLTLVGSHNGREGSVQIRQDVEMFAGHLKPGADASLKLKPQRHAWVQVIKGSVLVATNESGGGDAQSLKLGPGDALSASNESELTFKSSSESEFIVFDLP